MVHNFHFLQSDMVFGMINSFPWIFDANSRVKQCPISMLFLYYVYYIEFRTEEFFRLLNSDWLIQIWAAEAICKDVHRCFPFDQNFRNFRNEDRWFGNFQGKVPCREFGNCWIFRKANHLTENSGDSLMKIKGNEFLGKYVRKFGCTSQGCHLFFGNHANSRDFLFSASSFARNYSELDISRKVNSDAYSKMKII